ncbi:hypothetical protein FB45DRAFT_889705 [Roridomyces roridus]|uniref:Uncharacterized protein n=1 Tax=Roridomyces roridus TaxID=1738132 RepID=A0AAD7CL79_9AGAR|nr:hypothetical protein FB45DRAFT_889705 [Roridomyces roridus]
MAWKARAETAMRAVIRHGLSLSYSCPTSEAAWAWAISSSEKDRTALWLQGHGPVDLSFWKAFMQVHGGAVLGLQDRVHYQIVRDFILSDRMVSLLLPQMELGGVRIPLRVKNHMLSSLYVYVGALCQDDNGWEELAEAFLVPLFLQLLTAAKNARDEFIDEDENEKSVRPHARAKAKSGAAVIPAELEVLQTMFKVFSQVSGDCKPIHGRQIDHSQTSVKDTCGAEGKNGIDDGLAPGVTNAYSGDVDEASDADGEEESFSVDDLEVVPIPLYATSEEEEREEGQEESEAEQQETGAEEEESEIGQQETGTEDDESGTEDDEDVASVLVCRSWPRRPSFARLALVAATTKAAEFPADNASGTGSSESSAPAASSYSQPSTSAPLAPPITIALRRTLPASANTKGKVGRMTPESSPVRMPLTPRNWDCEAGLPSIQIGSTGTHFQPDPRLDEEDGIDVPVARWSQKRPPPSPRHSCLWSDAPPLWVKRQRQGD